MIENGFWAVTGASTNMMEDAGDGERGHELVCKANCAGLMLWYLLNLDEQDVCLCCVGKKIIGQI